MSGRIDSGLKTTNKKKTSASAAAVEGASHTGKLSSHWQMTTRAAAQRIRVAQRKGAASSRPQAQTARRRGEPLAIEAQQYY